MWNHGVYHIDDDDEHATIEFSRPGGCGRELELSTERRGGLIFAVADDSLTLNSGETGLRKSFGSCEMTHAVLTSQREPERGSGSG